MAACRQLSEVTLYQFGIFLNGCVLFLGEKRRLRRARLWRMRLSSSFEKAQIGDGARSSRSGEGGGEKAGGQAQGRHVRGPDGTGGTWSGWTRSIRHLVRISTPGR